MMATLWPKHAAAINNCYSKVVHLRVLFLLFCIPEAQWGHHTFKLHREMNFPWNKRSYTE